MLENRHLLVLTIVVILVAGVSALVNLPRLEDPSITNRNPMAITFFPGASAERVEALVSEPLEQELQQMDEINQIESTSRAGVSVLSLELQDWVDDGNNEEIYSKIRDRLKDAAQAFPPGASPPDFVDDRGAQAFTLLAGLRTREGAQVDLNVLRRLAEELGDRLRNLDGTELVRLYGAPREEVTVEVEAADLAALGMSHAELAELIAAADAKGAAGAYRGRAHDVFMEVEGELDSLARIARIPLAAGAAGQAVYLGDLARLEKSWRDPPVEIGLIEGRRTIFVGARMQSTLRVDRWTQEALDVVDRFREDFGAGADIDVVFTQNRYTEQRLGELAGNLLAGVGVVMLVVLLAMGWKSALIVGLALPLSMAGALFSLTFFGEGIHQMSIFGMIIAIGLVIDSAIVVTDEIHKNIRDRGLSRAEALRKTVHHLRVPLFASTFTTILGFMPIFLLPGNVGDFVSPIAISVIMALAFSYLLAITVIVTLAALFTRPGNGEEGPGSFWQTGLRSETASRRFRALLYGAFRRPRRTVALICVIPLLGFALAGTLGNVFFPPADRDHFQVQVWMPPGTSLERTAEVARTLDETIHDRAGVLRSAWLAGGSFPSVYYNQVMKQDGLASYAQGIVWAESVQRANALIDELQRELEADSPMAQVVVRAFGQGPPVRAPVSFQVYGPDLETLREMGEHVRRVLDTERAVTHTMASIEGGKPKLWLRADEDAVRRAGLTLREVAGRFQAGLEGAVGGSILEGIVSLPVRVQVSGAARRDVAHLASFPLPVEGQTGPRWVPASAFGELALRPVLTGATRTDGVRVNRIDAYLYPEARAIDVTESVLEKLEGWRADLPASYRLEVKGDADKQREAVSLLVTYLPVLLMLMAATLILSFRSARLALLIAVVGVLSAGMGMFSLWVSGFPIGFNPLIGSAGLVGVAINGSIVVLASILAHPAAAAGRLEDIVDETMGASRHILSTTFTTVGGFMPLLLSGGSFWPPLAIVIAGGVGLSVLLSLGFTPAVIAWSRGGPS